MSSCTSRYTAREAGGLLRNGAVTNLKTQIEEAQAAGSVRLFSMRHEFPTELAKFMRLSLLMQCCRAIRFLLLAKKPSGQRLISYGRITRAYGKRFPQ